MTDLEAILEAIDALSKNDLDKLRQHIDQRIHNRQPNIQTHGVENWITNLQKNVNEFREGLSEADIEQIVDDMNSE